MLNGCEIPRIISVDRVHTFSKISLCNDCVLNGERHDYWEIVFVMEGTVGITADTDIYVLEKCQAIIHKPNEFHKIWSEFGTKPQVIIFSFSADCFPETDGRIMSLSTAQMKKIEELYKTSFDCFERSSIEIVSPKSDKAFELEYFKLHMELFLLSVIQKQTPVLSGGLKSAEIYSAAVRIMEESPNAGFCIDDIAMQCSISSSYLKKIFIKYSGCGVMQYYNRLRARIACGHLDNGRSVKETALLLGFADQNYFSTFFKRTIGVSPTEFKNHNR